MSDIKSNTELLIDKSKVDHQDDTRPQTAEKKANANISGNDLFVPVKKSPDDEPEQIATKKDEEKSRTLNSIITLKDINLLVKRGEFVCIIGNVGSGKSSLLSAMIGDLLYVSPT